MSTLSSSEAVPSKNGPHEAAKIQLESFSVPQFDEETHQNISSLTLTSNITLSSYGDILGAPFSIPALPSSITSLELELFTLGYPAGFLADLAAKLPNITELTLYSQLIAGATAETFADAVQFFRLVGKSLRSLHFLDVFVPPDFLPAVSAALEDGPGLRALEVSWTFRPEDKDFNEKLPIQQIAGYLRPGLVALTVGIRPHEDSPGMMPCGEEMSAAVPEQLMQWSVGEAIQLKALDLTALALEIDTFVLLAERFTGVVVCSLALRHHGTEETKRKLLEACGKLSSLQKLEVIWAPDMEFYSAMNKDKLQTLSSALTDEQDVKGLSSIARQLEEIDISIFRVSELGYARWKRGEDDKWGGKADFGADLTGKERARISELEQQAGV